MTYPYNPMLDSRVQLTGSYNFGTGLTTWTLPYADSTINAVVVGYGGNAGTVLTPTVSGTSVTVAGNYSLGPCVLGRIYTKLIELTRPFKRDGSGIAQVSEKVRIDSIRLAHVQSMAYTIKASSPARPTRSKSFAVSGLSPDTAGGLTAGFGGDAATVRHFIENSTAMPSCITGGQFAIESAPDRARNE